MSNKTLIITASMVHRTPHVEMYINIFNKFGVEYDVVVWNRKGDIVEELPSNYILYNNPTYDLYPSWRKVVDNWKFSKYIKKKIQKEQYSSVVVIDIITAVFFYSFLIKDFKHKYIFDIRDYSPICNIKIGQWIVKKLIDNSFRTVISSRGFKKWLPDRDDYIISHNIDYSTLLRLTDYESSQYEKNNDSIILTIGNLRDPEAHKILINAFKNKNGITLRFVGDGLAAPILEDYCKRNNVVNVSFEGYYKKSDEIKFYCESDFISCCMENNILSNYLMSNRIYLAALTHKPIICFTGSYQSQIIDKYGLGMMIDRDSDIQYALNKYKKDFDRESYERNRMKFIQVVLSDYNNFFDTIKQLKQIK